MKNYGKKLVWRLKYYFFLFKISLITKSWDALFVKLFPNKVPVCMVVCNPKIDAKDSLSLGGLDDNDKIWSN